MKDRDGQELGFLGGDEDGLHYSREPVGLLGIVVPVGKWTLVEYRPLTLRWRVLMWFGITRSCE